MSAYLKLRILLSVFSGIGLIFFIVAFIIPRWSKNDTGSHGLWQKCYLNGGVSTCSIWTAELKTSSIFTTQIMSCLGLIFYCVFTVTGALTIFWTNHWKTAKVIKYSTFVFAVMTVLFVAVSIAIFKNNNESGDSTDISWYFAIIACVIAGIAAPFYLIDACRTVPPQKPTKQDKVKLFQNMNVPPQPTLGQFGKKESPFKTKGGRPPLLGELTRQKSAFVLPTPTKKANNKLTLNDIASFPLPPSKTKFDLMDETETENHPAPQEPTIMVLPMEEHESEDDSIENVPCDIDNENKENNNKLTLNDIASFPLPPSKTKLNLLDPSEKEDHPTPQQLEKEANGHDDGIQKHSVFKFHNTKIINKDGKKMVRIKNDEANLPPVLMVMPPDKNTKSSSMKKGRDTTKSRQKFGAYFVNVTDERSKSFIQKDNDINKRLRKAGGVYSTPSHVDMRVYPPELIKRKKRRKRRRKKKKKKNATRPPTGKSLQVETCVGTYDTESVKQQQHDSSTDTDTDEDEEDFGELSGKSDSESVEEDEDEMRLEIEGEEWRYEVKEKNKMLNTASTEEKATGKLDAKCTKEEDEMERRVDGEGKSESDTEGEQRKESWSAEDGKIDVMGSEGNVKLNAGHRKEEDEKVDRKGKSVARDDERKQDDGDTEAKGGEN